MSACIYTKQKQLPKNHSYSRSDVDDDDSRVAVAMETAEANAKAIRQTNTVSSILFLFLFFFVQICLRVKHHFGCDTCVGCATHAHNRRMNEHVNDDDE